MKELHSLLAREVERHFGGFERVPANLAEFLDRVNDAYRGLDDDRRMVELSLALRSQELVQARADLRTHEELEVKLREQTEELTRAREVAEATNRAKLTFLNHMNHELRTPLSAVIGFAELIQERVPGDLTARQEQYIQIIADSGRQLLSLIDEILDLAKVDSAPTDLDYAPVAITSLLKRSLSLFKEKCLKHGIRQSLGVRDEAEGLIVALDERKIRRVLFNLLSNAVTFTPDGGQISIELALLRDTGDTAGDGPRKAARLPAVQISVLDTGVGIAPEHLDRVFDAFSQIRDGTTDKGPGAGLGLALVRQLVELHGGRVWVESEGEGRGSAFRFTIPIDPAPTRTDALGGREESRT